MWVRMLSAYELCNYLTKSLSEDYNTWIQVGALKAELETSGVSYAHCTEKQELVGKLINASLRVHGTDPILDETRDGCHV